LEKIHGGDIYSLNKKVIDFSVNINPLGVSDEILLSIKNSLIEIVNYPDIECEALKTIFSEKENICKDFIVFGNGAAEIIFNITNVIRPKKVLLIAPSFAEYERASNSASAKKSYYFLKEIFNFDILDDILTYIKSEIDMLFLCSPNNPTGRCTDIKLILEIIKKCKTNNVFVVIDESFMDFVIHSEKYSFMPYIKKYDNVLILKSFTKIYAIPGIRLGCGICSNERIIKKIHLSRQPWNISVLAQKAGISALSQENFTERTRIYVKKEKEFLIKNFSSLKITYFDSMANYILFKGEPNLDKKLLNYNILIRNCKNFIGLSSGYFRTSIKSHYDNKILIEALKDIYENIGLSAQT